MGIRVLLLLGLILLAACSAVPASQPHGGETIPSLQGKDPDEAARKSLEAFRALVTDENFKALGFVSRDEVSVAQLDVPLHVFRVQLDQLQKYEPRSDPEKLLIDSDRVIYPITVKEQIRSSLEVEKNGDSWQGTNFGSPELVKLLTTARKDKSDFVVWVPALNLYFIANRRDNRLQLTPILDYPNLGLSAGRTLTADEAFTAILSAARSHDGLPN
jgi:hypothetical protein